MADERKFSRERHRIKLLSRESVQSELTALLNRALLEQDPTAHKPALRLTAELTALVASLLLTQTQTTQRAFSSLKDDIPEIGVEFVSQLIALANKDVSARIIKTTVAAPPLGDLPLADDWAGPVAGPTLIERHFGIPRSTLHRWQKRNEAVAINTRTSRKPVFPLRQFVDGRPVEGISQILAILPDHRLAWRWLTVPHPMFEGRQPLDDLLAGHLAEVVEAAKAASLTRRDVPSS